MSPQVPRAARAGRAGPGRGGGGQAGCDPFGAPALTDPWPCPALWPALWPPGGETSDEQDYPE